MAGIQISGLVANSAFDWKTVVDQLIAADSIPITTLQKEQTTNSSQISALTTLSTDLTTLQSSLQDIRSGDLFSARSVSSDTTNSTWSSTSSKGAALGSYAFNVTQLATQATVQGASGVGGGINSSGNVTGLTIANLRTATAITAGSFTVNGQQVAVATTDSLQNVFDAISTATAGDVSASYDSSSDKITLSSASGTPIVLGAANDTSNFIAAMKLYNNGTSGVTSSGALGVVNPSATLMNAGLNTTLSGQDGTGNGSFTVNGVSISYNTGTDTIAGILAHINSSSAGVTATYDSANNRFNLTNSATGDSGIAVADVSGNLMGALGLTTAAGGTFNRGTNALYSVNGGQQLVSTTNTLDATSHGITGLSVKVTSKGTQTLTVASDTNSMQTAIQAFVDNFNAVQDFINTSTKTTISGSSVTTSVLTNNHEVDDWASKLQSLAFETISGVSKTVTKLDDLGIDFDGTALNGKLVVKDATKLGNALSQNPADVQSFFLTANTGFVAKMYDYLTKTISADTQQQNSLSSDNSSLNDQITTLQTRLADERTNLTNSFISMLDAQSSAQSQATTLSNAFGSGSSSSCWVARVVYGARDPRWIVFRYWLLWRAPSWFRWAYLRYGERGARWLEHKPRLRGIVRRWMDARVNRLVRF